MAPLLIGAPARVAGVDGCKGGWVAVVLEPDGTARAERIARVEELFARAHAPELMAIDMPIGLPEQVGPRGRAPEREVRPLLGRRRSSVFSMPSRAAVYAGLDALAFPEEGPRYRHACAVARATSTPPRKISKQAFHIFPKIAEIDLLLRTRPELRPRIHECHPEVSFWAMNGRSEIPIAKKVRNAPHKPGLELRRQLLAGQGFAAEILSSAHARSLGVGEDDLIDACAAAWTASRIAAGTALAYPSPPEADAHGLPVCITA
ncbi:DUF429 domain-containing protein [Ancylobacter pratisalsi]|uniref:DUF429 domain-containing protein n=1 Tax=Ancylobacter pratisalsi TaxID=1745854 RepID=A0A6P1YS66_9HYPH|nr:DUF429 domain-containing protein [Ancylobacter pratisalsi]QIB34893.1 DUF429 domain-containing protein [Ancylobacter pratisalsi]